MINWKRLIAQFESFHNILLHKSSIVKSNRYKHNRILCLFHNKMSQPIETEIMDLQTKIQVLESELHSLNNEKSNVSEDQSEILTDEIIGLEVNIESEKIRHNNLLQLRDYQMSCDHSFIEDLIDITPEKSQVIKYCKSCLFTCEN